LLLINNQNALRESIIDRYTVLGATKNPKVPGLGFRYDIDDRWATPNPTGLPGVFEGYCPPHYKDMKEATKTLIKRKFGVLFVTNYNIYSLALFRLPEID